MGLTPVKIKAELARVTGYIPRPLIGGPSSNYVQRHRHANTKLNCHFNCHNTQWKINFSLV